MIIDDLNISEGAFKEMLKNNISVTSRLKYINDDITLTGEDIKRIIAKILLYSFKDSEGVYTNGTILVPVFRVLDFITNKGGDYCESR